MLRIDLTPLSDGVHQLTLTPSPNDIDLDPDLFDDLRVDVQINLAGPRALVALKTHAVATLECDRTLVLYEEPVEGRYQMLFAPPSVTGEADDASVNDDIRPWHPGEHEIDLTEAVRDTILLSLPTRRIAPGAEDAEIPTVFGDDGGIDPRWEALRALREDDSGEQP